MQFDFYSGFFFFSSRRRHTRLQGDWSSDVCSSDLEMRAVLGAASQGSGLGLVFRQFASAEIASGAVVPILDQFLPPDQPFHLYYTNRAHSPSKLRAFIEFMQTVNRKVSK